MSYPSPLVQLTTIILFQNGSLNAKLQILKHLKFIVGSTESKLNFLVDNTSPFSYLTGRKWK